MAEIRRDPVTGRWVIVATERAARPRDFFASRGRRRGGFCPFCEGNEDRTPPEIMAVRPSGGPANTPGWKVRVVPNKYPALQPADRLLECGHGFYQTVQGVGEHEVLIESPRHLLSPSEMATGDFELVIQAYCERSLALSAEDWLAYVLIFKNVGQAAGASIEHTHSQLIGLPVMPKRVEEEMRHCMDVHTHAPHCLFCDMIERELKEQVRVVMESEQLLVFCPFAARFPFEMCVLPKAHARHFHDLDAAQVSDLASVLQEALARLEVCLKDPPYNYVIHTTPVASPDTECYHWHIELIPRVTRLAGFEWGTGFYINPMEPERAAEYLRQVPEQKIAEKMASIPAAEAAGR